ncbi:MAG: M1 family metallopeptidase [Bradyrhizobium sp.]|uniref:M1 family metallopeptidase n=1 Tax=Bradyrhizobium sp. TaxID=376 RepID=UPI001D5BD0E1|nr:M1 family metallopeptidase [Bradyrhizobium sp.]MBV9565991.1 M1 family metallopeptidase [Bradyrhizobium sp.]
MTALSAPMPFFSCRRAAFAVAALLAVLPPSGGACAEPTFSFDAAPGKLARTVVPVNYAIELEPDLQGLTFNGNETVDIELREAATQITLNAVAMTIADAAIDAETDHAAVALDAAAETATLSFTHPLAPGAHRLRLSFTGKINPFARGLYYVDYPTESGSRRMIASQLEPADARRIFPCWDEPAFKASFALTVTVPQSFLAVGNMPVVQEQPSGADRKRVTFAPTPKMSSYLFVFVTGELERIATEADGVNVGVVTTTGKSEKGRFALENGAKLLGYYNDYFGARYPLPKLDLIAVPGGFGGAMENWGGIVFFESALLFDPLANPETARRNIFSIIAHEMAHQWFGDLVTMGWWDNLWLNEGFASWMQEKAAEQFYPQWRTWLNGYAQKQFALALDARRTSHPIQQKVADQSEAMTAFDGITYNKGQAFIRMLESYLGEDAFRSGIRSYMAAHAYGNTTTADLWQALEKAAGKPVADIAAGFTEQSGVPLVVAETACDGAGQHLTLRQDRFANVPAHSFDGRNSAEGREPRHWKIPVALGTPGAAAPSQVLLLDDSADIGAGACGAPVKVNFGDIGYYRVEYGPNSRVALLQALPQMAVADRLNLLTDNWALASAGRADPASYLSLTEALQADDHRVVWDQVIGAFAALDHLARGDSGRPALQAYARARLRPVFDRLGWDVKGPGDDDDTLLRARLIRTLGEYGDADILAEAKRRFASFLNDPKSLPPALRDAVSQVVGLSSDRDTHEALLALARKSTATNERVRYYYAAAGGRAEALARATLDLTLTNELPNTIRGNMINIVASTAERPDLAWDFVQQHLDVLTAKQGPDFRDHFVPNFMTNFNDEAHANELKAFAPAQATSGGRVMTARALETMAIAVDEKTRVLPLVEAWIAHHADGAR